MKRWAVITLVVVVIISVVMGSILQLIWTLSPTTQNQGLLPFVYASGITAIIANTFIAIMQLFGKSPADFFPEKTPREEDPRMFKLTRSKDPQILKQYVDYARRNDAHKWTVLFAEQWSRIQPGEVTAFENLGEAYLKTNQPQNAIEAGNRVMSLNKLSYSGCHILGEAYEMLGMLEESRKWHELAVTYVRDGLRKYYVEDLGEIYARLGRIDDGIITLETALKMENDEARKVRLRQKIAELKAIQTRISQAQ